MQDQPEPLEILKTVAAFLRATVIPQATPHTAFQARVAANALDLVGRQIALAPAAELAEAARLHNLLGCKDSLENLNALLAQGIEAGTLHMNMPGLTAHLWATSLEKLAVDQPRYSGYRAALDETAPSKIGEI